MKGTDLARVAWIIAMAAVAIHFETWWIALLGIFAFYEAEDVAKQIDKDINVRSKTEPQTERSE